MKQYRKYRTVTDRWPYLAGAFLLLLLLGLPACSVNKNTSLSRGYHNLTSHYNIYFNGKESFKKGIERAEASVSLDYSQILPLFLYEVESVHSSASGDMKRSIDKATKVITFHSITAKPKVKEGDQSPKDKAFYEKNEYNKWVDDCYMLMGRSYMYQGEFFLAAETFKHVLVTFPAEDVRFLGMIWLARAYIMIDELREAERILMSLSDESDLPEEYMEVFYSTQAQFEMMQESHSEAASYLEQALQQKGLSKEEKIRYTYILAQLYEEAGENELALERYKQVTRYNPPYEMAFNARVSMAEVFEAGSASSEDLKKLLHKMLRDSKNKEYKDQIYFALGNIAWEEGDEELAIEYYQLSVSSSMQNRHQKGLSSVTLAEIFYEQPEYMLSAAYYDSAVSFLRQDYPDMAGLRNRASSLGDLVYYVNSYTMEDSLQMLASLSEAARFSIIDGIIEDVRKAEEEARQAEIQAMQDMAFDQSMLHNNQTGSQNQQQGGTWYFYNLNAKSFGQPEFRMRWGDRPLEDNWRRANKQSLSPSDRPGEGAESDSTDQGTPIFDNKSREFYLASIPLTDSAMEESDKRLELALFNMGSIYRENLLDYQVAISTFEEELQRYPHPDGNFNPQVMYYLYDLYNSIQKPDRAQYYKGQLARLYPDSHYTKLLNNPNYIRELEEEEMKVTRIYEDVYGHYQAKEYTEVISMADSALVQYPEDPLAPKFKYIKALSVGAMTGKEEMKVELDSLISHHPETEEGQQAQELVDYMFEAFPVIKEAEEARVAEEIYTAYDSAQEHYLLIALPASEDVNQVSFDLLNFNLDHFNEYDLNIEDQVLDDGFVLVSVQTFINAEGARRYLQQVEENRESIFGDIPSSVYRIMIISLDNYSKLFTEKVHNPYYLFYQKHYLKLE